VDGNKRFGSFWLKPRRRVPKRRGSGLLVNFLGAGAVAFSTLAMLVCCGFTGVASLASAVGLSVLGRTDVGMPVLYFFLALHLAAQLWSARTHRRPYAMPEDQRRKAMAMMIEALYSLPDEDMARLVQAHIAILASLPETQRRTLMAAHMATMQSYPESQRRREMKMVQEAVQRLPASQKRTMMAAMEMMKGMPTPAMARPREEPVETIQPREQTGTSSTAIWILLAIAVVVVIVVLFIALV